MDLRRAKPSDIFDLWHETLDVQPMSTPDCRIEAAHVQMEIDDQQFLIAHGTSRFLKPDRVQDMKRKAKTGAASGFLVEALDEPRGQIKKPQHQF